MVVSDSRCFLFIGVARVLGDYDIRCGGLSVDIKL